MSLPIDILTGDTEILPVRSVDLKQPSQLE